MAFGFPESAMREPADTIVFGEKNMTSFHVHMDFYQNNDINGIAEQVVTAPASRAPAPGLHYAFGDGSVRFLRFGRALSPSISGRLPICGGPTPQCHPCSERSLSSCRRNRGLAAHPSCGGPAPACRPWTR